MKFRPIAVAKMWGGNRLSSLLNKPFKGDKIGESWEIADAGERASIVSEGPLKGQSLRGLIQRFGADLIGEAPYRSHGDRFPLLVKFIDAQKPLSLQVHPNDKLAQARHHAMGKSEIWYVLHADPGSELIAGFSHPIDAQTYLENLKNRSLERILRKFKVKKGDWFYLPAGRIHAIGAGIVLAEIQQNSILTYRIYDYDRIDPETGKARELHTELALEALDFSTQTDGDQQSEGKKALRCSYFKADLWTLEKAVSYREGGDRFTIFMGVTGDSQLRVAGKTTRIALGETLLLPAVFEAFTLEPLTGTSQVLRVTL